MPLNKKYAFFRVLHLLHIKNKNCHLLKSYIFHLPVFKDHHGKKEPCNRQRQRNLLFLHHSRIVLLTISESDVLLGSAGIPPHSFLLPCDLLVHIRLPYPIWKRRFMAFIWSIVECSPQGGYIRIPWVYNLLNQPSGNMITSRQGLIWWKIRFAHLLQGPRWVLGPGSKQHFTFGCGVQIAFWVWVWVQIVGPYNGCRNGELKQPFVHSMIKLFSVYTTYETSVLR